MSIADFSDKLEAANTAYSSTFDALGDVFPGTFNLFSEDLSSDGDGSALNIGYTEDLGTVRVMKPGESRKYDGLRAFGATYDLEEVYSAHRIARIKVENDPSGRIAKGLQRAAQRALEIIETRIWDTLKANTKTGVDGVALISASHTSGSLTQSNLTTTALGHSSYRAGKAAMRGLERENGQPYNINPTHLFVPEGLEDVAREVTGADKVVALDNTGAEATSGVVAATSIKNVYQGDTTVVVTPRMTAGTWLLMDLSTPGFRPWVHKLAKSPTPIMPDPRDESNRQRSMLEYILSGDIAQGPGNWQTAYGKIA